MTRLNYALLLALCVTANACLSFSQHGYRGDQRNIYGQELQFCSFSPMTGWFRDGYARTDNNDRGLHVVCATMTDEFLQYTKAQGNDLSTPRPWFPGLRAGDRWALCAVRWYQAYQAGKAPLVKLSATNVKALTVVPRRTLEQFDDRLQTNP